jgi:leucyl/phenylalanyl-tRNA--protein transferase
MPALHWLPPDDPGAPFPPTELACEEPNGLLAAGGDLSPGRLLAAYRAGIFPWYSAGEPILWWSPDPRTVLFPERLRISRRLARTLRQRRFEISYDRDFDRVVAACAAPRPGTGGTWITPEMGRAYGQLHALGHAHAIEVWDGSSLVGGLYGVVLGRVFFGESMFSAVRDASKVALAHLCARLRRRGFTLLDCQVVSGHLLRMGAETIPRSRFQALLAEHLGSPSQAPLPWPGAPQPDEVPA